MKLKPIQWTENLFNEHIKFIDKEALYNRIKESIDSEEELEELELNKNYMLSQDLFGVKIENGLLRITKYIISDAVELVSMLVGIFKTRKEYVFKPLQDVENMTVLTRRLGLELPDIDAIQGYIMNQELVDYYNSDYSVIQIKYKDNPENIFYIYKFYFVDINGELYLVIEKNI